MTGQSTRMLLITTLTSAVLSCSALQDTASAVSAPEEAEKSATFEAADISEGDVLARKVDGAVAAGPSMGDLSSQTLLIVTTDMDLEVEAFDEALDSIKEIARQAGGRIASSSSRRDDEGLMSGTIEVKIPAKGYGGALDEIADLGEVQDMRETSQDVTEEYVDLEARLDNSLKLEQRILGLLAESTGTIDDVLHVEKELASVRENIERLEGRRRYLESRISMSTITVDLHEKGAARGGDPTAGQVFGRIMNKVGVVFVGSVGVLITFVVAVAPWAVAAGLLALVIVLLVRIAHRKKPAPVVPAA
ncbi:MAG: DUF4349 domain-containing protein [Deltaproteobacteria bacterium]|nr:DUF4349 domain-containing protein [Deltaproteobacteria bacterium]